MGFHTLDVENSGWADIASMQEHVAHLPDAVRRDRWSLEYWTTAPSHLMILKLYFHFSRRSDSSHIAFLGDQSDSIIRVWNITHTYTFLFDSQNQPIYTDFSPTQMDVRHWQLAAHLGVQCIHAFVCITKPVWVDQTPKGVHSRGPGTPSYRRKTCPN